MSTISSAKFVRNRESTFAVAICLALTGLVWGVFGQTLDHEFVNYDDNRYVFENAEVSRGLTLGGVKWAFTHAHSENWHPLTTISHMIDCSWYGLQPSGHHFSNVLLHTFATVFLFVALWQMTGALWRSAIVAALFAIHPLRVESVAWIAERKDVLSGTFFMLTLLAYARYARAASVGRYLLVVAFLASGLMAKPMLVTVPFLLLLLDYWPLQQMQSSEDRGQRFAGANFTAGLREREDANRSREAGGSVRETERTRTNWSKLVMEKIPLLCLSAASTIVTISTQRVTMSSLGGLPLSMRAANAIDSIVVYLRQLFWPVDLAVFYPYPRTAQNILVIAGEAALIVAITFVALFSRRRYPYFFVGWFWYVIALIPVLGLIQVGLQAHADRYNYLPQIGLLIALTWGLADLSYQWWQRNVLLPAASSAAIIALAAVAIRQTTYWHDSVSLWSHTVAATKDNDTAELNLAEALLQRGRLAEAITHSQAAIRINPENAGRFGRVPIVLTDQDAQAAIAYWQSQLELNPNDANAHNNLGVVLMQSGDPRGAIAQWEQSLAINPNDGNAENNLAWVLSTYPDGTLRNGARAVELAEKAAALPGGQDPIVLRTLAAAHAEAGDFSKATQIAERAAESARSRQNASLAQTLEDESRDYREHVAHREMPRRQ
ncbi:MAG TPA: tetratricopeptide repeat protein [Chthoniobacterales bacterium]